jgi:peptide/nickel transport system ATP-binding protein
MNAPLLDVRHLSVAVRPQGRSRQAECFLVRDVSFTLERGKILGLIGESGAGKSTIGLAVLGYCRDQVGIAGGQILFDGADIAALSAAERARLRGSRITYVAQSAASAFNPAFTLGEQIIEATVSHGLASRGDALRRAGELLALLDLPDPENFLHRYPHQASGGQLQRAMTAMALCPRPDLIVFDEPTTALDVTTQLGVLLAIRRAIASTGVSGLYISHDLAVVTQIADHILVLRDGQTVEYGSADQIINAPAHDYTRRLVSMRGTPGGQAHTESGAILSTRGIHMSYRNGAKVLSDVSIDVPPAHTLALVGQSGSGKTTLGRVICGLSPASSGQVLFHGQPLASSVRKRRREELRRIQMIHQIPDLALNPRQTVEDVIGRPLTLYWQLRGAERRQRIRDLLAQVELPDTFLDRRPGALSGGQKQRVCIARALAARPDVIICDEPTSALDPLVAQGVLELLKRLQVETNVSYLFITHDIHVVRSIAHSTAVMHQGRIIRAGGTTTVLAPPYDAETERLLRAVPEMQIGWLDRWIETQHLEPGLITSV